MNNKILLSALIICFVFTANVLSDDQLQSRPKTLLRDGYSLELVTGVVQNIDGKWMFTTKKDINDNLKTLQAGSSIELLGSSTLERMQSWIDSEDNQLNVRLQATVTKYKGKNYLFPSAFIPLAKTPEAVEKQEQKQQPQTQEPTEPETQAQTDKTKAESVLSDDVKSLLSSDWVPNLKKPRKPQPKPSENTAIQNTNTESAPKPAEPVAQAVAKKTISNDFNIVGRTGFITTTGDTKTFKFDSLGRKIDNTYYIILPGSSLDWIDDIKYDIPGRRRYKVSGIVTQYQGQNYLLLQRLARTYSHGNFAQ